MSPLNQSSLTEQLSLLAGNTDTALAVAKLTPLHRQLRKAPLGVLLLAELALEGKIPAPAKPGAPAIIQLVTPKLATKKKVVVPARSKPVSLPSSPLSVGKAPAAPSLAYTSTIPTGVTSEPPQRLSAPIPRISLRDVRPPFLAVTGPRRTLAIATTSLALAAVLVSGVYTAIKPTSELGTVAGVSTEQVLPPTSSALPTPVSSDTPEAWQKFSDAGLGISFEYAKEGTSAQVSSSGNTLSVADSNGLVLRATKVTLDPGADMSAWLQRMERDARTSYRFVNGGIAGLTGRVGTSQVAGDPANQLYLVGRSISRTENQVYQIWIRKSDSKEVTRILSSFTFIK